MKEKYYTPDITEFHVGFDYQYNCEDGWIDDVYYFDNLSELYPMIIDNKIRVKYLDRVDIKDVLGVKPIDDITFRVGNSDLNYYEIHYNYEEGELFIENKFQEKLVAYRIEEELTSITLFDGEIKNKNELKWVLKRLGIITISNYEKDS